MKQYLRDDVFLKQFGERIRELRTQRGISQEQLANELGTTQVQISRIEAGTVNTSISHAAAIASALGLKVKNLFDF